jgi:CelD/BcsL family acetyltransferase involved in cellulose biosynthesis
MVLERHRHGGALTPISWDLFVGAHPAGTPFHLSAWMRCLCETYAFEGSLFTLSAPREIVAVLPLVKVRRPLRRPVYVSLPFSDYGGVLARDAQAGVQLMDGLAKVFDGKKNRLEIRGAVPEGRRWQQTTSYVRHALDLTVGMPEICKHLDKRTIRYSIRKAERSGIRIEEATSADGATEFYRLHRLTRAKHGVPSQPLQFFHNLLNELAPTATPSILLALHDGSAIAAGLFIEFKRTLYFKYSAADPERLSSMTPNHLLTWHAIESACERGLERFDFGRSARSDEGLCRYKRMWGAVESALPYSYYPADGRVPVSAGETGTAYGLVTSLWRKLPRPMQNRIGPRVYKYLA